MSTVLEESLDAIAHFVDGFDPRTVSGSDARRLAELFARGEKLCVAGKLLAARRVADCSAWTGNGARSPEEWLAALSGTTVGSAGAALETAERLGEQPALEDAVKAGDVSLAQASQISQATEAAPEDPGAGKRLIDEVKSGATMRRLKERCRAVANSARNREDDEARLKRLRAQRFFRTWVDSEGAGWGQFKLAPDAYARFMATLRPFQDEAFAAARRAGRHESYGAYGADGLMAMAAAATTTADADGATAKAKVPATAIFLIDLAAYRRGAAGEEETCELVGVGKVPVSAVADLLSDALVAAAIVDGTDIRRVVHLGRHATALQRTALWIRDRACIHCASLHNLQIDHVDEWHGTRKTQLDKLAFLCKRCHDLKTYRGWRLVGTPGQYKLIEPDAAPDPPDP